MENKFTVKKGKVSFQLQTDAGKLVTINKVATLDILLETLFRDHRVNIFTIVDEMLKEVAFSTLHHTKHPKGQPIMFGDRQLLVAEGATLGRVLSKGGEEVLEQLKVFYIQYFAAEFVNLFNRKIGK